MKFAKPNNKNVGFLRTLNEIKFLDDLTSFLHLEKHDLLFVSNAGAILVKPSSEEFDDEFDDDDDDDNEPSGCFKYKLGQLRVIDLLVERTLVDVNPPL